MVVKTIENEIKSYINEKVSISPGYKFSQHKMIKRIMIYANGIYPSGKLDGQGKYKYWFDVITPRIEDEVKNIDFDTKNIILYSKSLNDALPVFLGNARMNEYLRDSGQARELNDAVYEFSAWGNVVWKKVEDGYERVDLKNFYVINQTAEYLDESPCIERHIYTQSDLRKKRDVWDNVDKVIKNCGNKEFKTSIKTNTENKTSEYYEIFERNGEISEKELRKAQGKTGGDPDKYILARIVCAGLDESEGNKEGKYILFADELKEMPYRESHRGKYKGRWLRQGIVEILMDVATRANEIGNQLSRGLEWASKTIFSSGDKTIAQNIITDLSNGDIIRSEDLKQVQTRMEGADQLLAEWNRLMKFADRLCHSFEVARGESMPSGTPFRMGALLNVNVNKFYDILRENLEIGLQDVVEDWILPDILKDLKAQDVIRLTGDSKYLDRYYKMRAKWWYRKNMLSMPAHNKAQKDMLIEQKMDELRNRGETAVKVGKGFWKEFKPRIKVVIAGENVDLAQELETMSNFIQLEADPVRRTALIEMAMIKKGIDVASLPKSEPQEQGMGTLTSPNQMSAQGKEQDLMEEAT